jgi:phenylalanyl-tRNA synthetase beta chain
MKFTLGWLRDFLDTAASVEEIAEKLTAIGLEVESVTDRAASLSGFVTAEILETRPHPQADKLRLCKVNGGSGEPLSVVCGAPNARPGIKVALAPIGVTVPASGMKIKPSKIRGEESCGMLCSAEELGLGGASDGIIELPAETQIGLPLAEALGLDDPVIEIAVTPNRGDCLGVYGVARALSAADPARFVLKPLEVKKIEGGFDSPVNVEIDGAACRAFKGRYFKNISNDGATPGYMRRRLEAVGQRLISPAVDVTNYILNAFGRPLHVFDADKLQGGLRVRLAQDGERFLALDGKEYVLDGTMAVVADAAGVQAVGGVIGGMQSGCAAETKDIFLEVALFDKESVARTGRRLNVLTDSRYRFERGVDEGFVDDAVEIATRCLVEICGGEASFVVNAGGDRDCAAVGSASGRSTAGAVGTFAITFRPDSVKRLTGVDVPAEEQTAILERLGFTINGDSTVTPPSRRHDISCEADLVEEIIINHGYDKIEETPLPPFSPPAAPLQASDERISARLKRVLAAQGLSEAVCWSFVSEAQLGRFGGTDGAVKIKNPISQEWAYMRRSLLPNLLRTLAEGYARRLSDYGLFEAGCVYAGAAPEAQEPMLAGARIGYAVRPCAHSPGREASAFDAKADFFRCLAEFGVAEESCRIEAEGPSYWHPGRKASVCLGKTLLGRFGEIHPDVVDAEGIKGRVAAFELYVRPLTATQKNRKAGRPPLKLSNLQASDRDFCFVLDADARAGDLAARIRKADKERIEEVRIFDVYSGEGVPAGKKSVALTVRIRPKTDVLTDEDLKSVSENIVKAAAGCGAELR